MIRRLTIRQILELIDTIQSGINYISRTQSETAAQVLDCCQLALKQISELIRDADITSAQFCLEKLDAVSEILSLGLGSSQCQMAKQRLEAVRKRLLKEPARLEIAFFPYKQSMWDCMESIWRVADTDPMCDCYVIPIPYYDRNPDGSFGTFHYEGAQFPKDIPVVDYESYDVAVQRPDIVYIHNPYDEFNRVTSVDPHYYSHNLKKHTELLVYIPYYIAGSSTKLGTKTTLTMYSAYYQADYIIAQSEGVKQGLIDLGIPEKRVLALGTPKLDYVIHHQPEKCPPAWMEKLQGRIVFLVNSSLTDLLGNSQEWLFSIQKLLIGIAEHKECAVIWRPHPLTEATIKSMRIEWLQFYQKMKSDLMQLDNFIYDQTSEYLPAFDVSHALISDYSSLFMMYGVTGKPVLLLTGSKSERETTDYLFIDYYDYYFVKDGFKVDSFIDMVKEGSDLKREKRMTSLAASLVNADGTAGEKIHKTIIERVMRL